MFSIKSPENRISSIYSVIRPLYIGARIFGFFPFSIKVQSNWKNSKIYFTFINFIVFVIHITVYVFFTYLNINHNFMENPAASPLLILGTRTLLILGISNGIICVSADLYHRHRIGCIFDQFQHFDFKMTEIGSSINYKQSKQCIYVYLLIWIIICLVYFPFSAWVFIDQYSVDAIAVIFSSYFILNNVFGGILSIYSFFLCSIKSRYCLINENFSQLLIETANVKVIATTSKKSAVENLIKLADLHDLLNDILEKVNDCYSIQAMLAVGMSFTYMVFCLFSCYRGWIMRTGDEHKQFYLAIILMLWSTYYNFFVFTVIWAAWRLSTRHVDVKSLVADEIKGKLTGILVHRAINRCRNTEIVGRLLALSQQLNHRVPDANCKLFSFDWTLAYSMVAATATYLIILIQFDASGYVPLP